MKRYESIKNAQGVKERVPKDLGKLFNLNYLRYTNKTYYSEYLELPELYCDTDVFPDFIVGYAHPADYHVTDRTAVAFYQYDNTFDGMHGLYNAIYHNDERLLKKFKKRFEGVQFFISPDFSQFGDVDILENLYRLKKARVISLWLAMELNAIVFPNITYPLIDFLPFYLNGLENCHVVAFSTMCYVDNEVERENIKAAVKFTVDTLSLHTIIVFDICGDNAIVNELFAYALEQGINVIVPPNSQKTWNTSKKHHTKEGDVK